ncbi:MAG: hypothetical protein U9R53_06810 [Chloroflexota bacterium]|nr:hypothetical protein [Chloroflexota bacterium]
MKTQKVVTPKLILMMVLFASLLAFTGSGCSGGNGNIEGSGGEPGESGHAGGSEGSDETGHGGGEAAETGHNEAGGEDGTAGGSEESGNTLALDEIYDFIRYGARLLMQYDRASNSFVGTVENTTTGTLTNVRVEVHLSNGIELGPTTPVDLAPGQIIEVVLPAASQGFTGWSPHAEVGSGEGSKDDSEDSDAGGFILIRMNI